MALMADSGRLGRVVGIDAEGAFRPMSARRLLVLGGIGLILVGMLFGDIFAVFVLHQNAAKVGESLSSAAQDRKSTRLNSSHGYISYAVFCLKKKKKIK